MATTIYARDLTPRHRCQGTAVATKWQRLTQRSSVSFLVRRRTVPGHFRQAPCIRVFRHLAIAALLAVPTLAGCHADDVAPLGVQGPGAALVVRGDSLLFLNDSAPYSAETPGTPDRGPREIDWSSSDSTIVSVGAQGIARARRIGTATLMATLTAPDLVAPMTRSFPVRVVYAAIAVDPVAVWTCSGPRTRPCRRFWNRATPRSCPSSLLA